MKHDPAAFAPGAVASAYTGRIADRVHRFMPMVRRLAWHVHGGGRPGIGLGGLVQAGLVALTECAQRHEGPGEDGFAAYAKLRVRGAMVDLVRRSLPISRGAAERRRRLREAEDALTAELGRSPTPTELAARLGMGQAELAAHRHANAPLRFEPIEETYSDHDLAFADDGPDSLDRLVAAELRGALIDAIGALPERLKLVIQLYFVEELNLAEIAGVLGVSIPRVHQIKAQALDKLRGDLAGRAEVF